MYNTYKLMSSCTNSTYLEKDLEQLCEEYKQTDDARKRNKIISAMFCKVFPMILKIQEKYYSLTNEQKVEHAIFHLIRSIEYYNKSSAKFSSFYHTHLTNQMKTLFTSENSLKKAVFQHIVKDNDKALSWHTNNTPDKQYIDTDDYMLDVIKNATKLSSEEKAYCICVLAGCEKPQQILQHLKLPVDTMKQRSTTKSKNISDPIKENKEITVEKQLQLEQDRQLRCLKKIKQSLKDKRNKYGQEGLFC